MVFVWGCNAREVTISFETNNGVQINEIKIEKGSFLTELPDAVRTGYDFSGWYYDANLSQPVDETAEVQRNLVIYASWEIQEYAINFQVDGVVVSTVNITYGTAITFPVTPVKTGYHFMGWYLGESYFNTDTIVTANTTLVAHFEANEYTVTFDLGNGTLETRTVEFLDDITTLPSSVLTPVAGKQIVWKTFEEGVLGELADFTDIDANMTVKSVYIDIYYDVTINDDQGNTIIVSVKYNDLLTRPAADPIKPHYNFVAWVDADGLQYDFATPVTAAFTITAQYTIQQFQVSFYDESGQMIGSPQSVNYGSGATAPVYTAPEGYTFNGWDADFSNITANLQLNVQLLGLTYSVTYHTNGGTTIQSVSQQIDTDLTRPANPTKVGYTFAGWFLNESLTNEYVLFSTMPFEGLELYAKWTANHYTITLNAQLGSVTPTSVSVTFNQAIGILPTPTRAGYSFLGWSLDPNDTVGNYYTSVTTYALSENVTLHAIWRAATYVVTLYVNGGEALLDNTLDVDYQSIMASLPTPVREGYTFLGWNTIANGSGVAYTSASTYQLIGNLSLYAIWEANSYSLAYSVEYYFENADDALFTLGEQISYPGTTDEEVSAIINTYDGLVYAADSENNVLSGTVASDGSLVLKVYYNRLTFTVNLVDSSEIASGSFTIKYDGTLSALPTPERSGYTFLGWADQNNVSFTATDTTNAALILYARWAQNTYTVTIERILMRGEEQVSSTIYQAQVLHGSEYSPVTTIEGYDFGSFVDALDNTYVSALDTLTITENQNIVIYYQMKTFTINFTQLLAVGGDTTLNSFTVYYDATFTNLPALILSGNAAYSLVIWNRSVFQHVKANIEVTAVYYPAGGVTVTFMDNTTIRYIITKGAENATGPILTDASAIWNLQKPGYVFLGWFYDQAFTQPVQISDLNFVDIASSITIYAKWQQLFPYATPTNIVVMVTNSVVSVMWNQTALSGVYPTQFILLVDGVEHLIDASMFTHDGNVFTCQEDFLSVLLVPGTHHVAVMAIGVSGTSLSSSYSIVLEQIVETTEEEIVGVQKYDYFIIETTVSDQLNYIFYSDMTYNFATKYSFVVLDGNEFISSNGNQLITNGIPGNFEIMMTKNVDGVITQTLIHGKVVAYINQFQLGTTLSDYLSEAADSNYLDPTFDDYLVGNSNDFHFDLTIRNNSGTEVNMSDTILDFDFYLKTGESYQLLEGVTLTQYVSQKTGYQFRFTTLAAGLTFKVEIAPHYQANAMTVSLRTFEFTVTDGYNVYTNEELQTIFKDMTKHKIILHSNIIAAVNPLYLNADGTPMNGYGQVTSSGIYDYRGNVYPRLGVSSNDTMVVEGNYFTIDGSNLPYLKTTSDPDTDEFGNGGYQSVGVGTSGAYAIVSVQVGIFNYNVTPDYTGGIVNNDNSVTYNNLTLLGNTTTPNVNYSLSADEILEQEELMSRNSGGFTGIMTRNGTTNLNNVNIGYTTIALFLTAYGYQNDGVTPIATNVDYIRTYDLWANSFYDFGSPEINISNSNIGSSGGAAIHVEDVRGGNSGIEDITVNIDAATQVNNWIAGDEAWFKAYGFSSIALLLKTNAEGGANLYNKTIIKMVENQVTGAMSEKINFVFLSRDMIESTDEEGTLVNGSEVILHFADATGLNTIDRAFDFLNTDIRSTLVSPGSLLFPVGAYSDSYTFGMSVYLATQYLMTTYSLDEGSASMLAVDAIYIAGMYNLTINQGSDAAIVKYSQQVSTFAAVYYVTGGNIPAQPRYVEVAQSAPGLGNVQLILELMDIDHS